LDAAFFQHPFDCALRHEILVGDADRFKISTLYFSAQ